MTTFHLFSNLPAELRFRIWHVALEDDYTDLKGRHRIIELHNYKAGPQVGVAVSRRYPTLFEVSREARCEAAKAGGGEWTTVKARFDGRQEPGHTTSFKIYINFSHDVVLLSDRAISQQAPVAILKVYYTSPEATKVLVLMTLLPNDVIKKLAHLMLTTTGVRYQGERLENFSSLERLHLYVRYGIYDVMSPIRQHISKAWRLLDSEAPRVSCFPPCRSTTGGSVDDRETMVWVSDSGVMDIESDGIRRVEWGLRKDLWVPRAKKGSGTLQKIG
ncbi:uncharacterized protein J4E88_002875 [Alternaria novae-zelandiae]|uniref:uncharacterized protein n=1 Tax=Alternaria novae-zelandiae TaxID=430562 RepID=UPI0020C45C8A|nr:uncharacterized protein J4E88_002875 [Alternaria novae-zelandiae]KAI4689523.1 hypothetical protein J4E88_002875 [Alternaria novae-zelandiae]